MPKKPAGHWQKHIQKTVYTLNVSPDEKGTYNPEICELTYPLIQAYADKIGARFEVITERKFPEFPAVYEKLQIFEKGKGGYAVDNDGEHVIVPPNDWNIFIDSDALVSPEFFDITQHLSKDTVCHNGKDMATVRWKYDQYFMRDGRHFGSCNWFTVGSDWCLDLWHPLEDLTLEQALKNIYITIAEHNSGQFKDNHLIDDYTLSRNIARYGLKTTTVTDICERIGWRGQDGKGFNPFLYHLYAISREEKVQRLLAVLSAPQNTIIKNPANPDATPWGLGWGLMDQDTAMAFREKWGLN
jgi:hypothetical protein